MGFAPRGDRVGHVGDARAEDERHPASSIAFWLAADAMPASATTVTSGSWWAFMNA
jgi:hypothetical protein